MRTLFKYSSLWWLLTVNSFQIVLTSRTSATLFVIAKLLRFVFFAVFLFALFAGTQVIANYSLLQAVIFYLTFNLIDTATQLFFREVYRFRQQVVSGDFDLVLVKPSSPLFRALAGGADPLDLIMLIPYVSSLVYAVSRLGSLHITTVGLYILLLMNGFFIATGFHILVLALAVATTEIDHAIMIYRDITSMARLPVDIYREPLRSFITFVVPVGVMMTFPAKALFGLLTPTAVIVSFLIGIAFLLVSVRVWGASLTRYASASS
ncbi:ABC-2 family transporter protein [Candidatus Gottesmanbacteria bacterium]|nr:ABC-2 family transporter protein [Candidatus Gottesmanbacteria bacterium]